MKRFYKFLMPLVAIVAMALPWTSQAQVVQLYGMTTGTDATKWITLSSAATSVSAILDDDEASGVMNIGFDFMFAGVNYSQWSCNSNGRVRLGSTVVSNYWVNPFTTTSLTNTTYGSDLPLISAFGMDNTLAGSGVWCKYEVVGTAPNRVLVIEYRTPSEYDEEGDLVNYQIQLEESTNIVRFVYGTSAASYFDDFQAGIASDVDDVMTISSTHDTILGATSNMLYAWPGTWRYYEFTHPTNFCAAGGNIEVEYSDGESLTVCWAPSSSASSYLVTINGTGYTTTDTSYTFTGLSSNTSYNISVRTLCTNGDTSIARTVVARTACGYMTIPYQNDFEEDPHYSTVTYPLAVPYCWTRINDATGTYNYYPYLYAYSTYAHSGSTGMYWYHSTTTSYANNEYAIMPPFDPNTYSANDLTLSFFAKTTSTSYHPQPIVGVMTDPTDTSTFTPVYTFTSSQITTAWQAFVIPLSSYTGNGNYIAIKWPRPSSACYMAIDDIFVTDEWCDMPTSVAVTQVTTDTVTLSWSAPGASNFVVYLGNDTVNVSNENTYTFDNLSPNTLYNYGVAVVCSSGNSMFVTGSIRTECTELTTLPYVQDFEAEATGNSSSAAFANCWHRLNNATSYFGYPYISSSTTYNHTTGGSKGLYWYNTTTTGTYGDYQVIVLPPVDRDVYAINNLMVKFWAKASSTSYHPTFIVGVMTDPNDISTFQAVTTINVSGTAWEEYEAVLNSYTGNGNYVAIRANRASSSWYAYVDDITLKTIPTCAHLTDLQAVATVGAALLTWTPSVSDAECQGLVEYREDAVTTWTSAGTTPGTSYTLTGLSSSTSYVARVAAICSNGDTSEWETVSFATGDFPCAVFDPASTFSDTINVGTSTSTYFPSYSFYGYGLTQQIYTAAEIGHGATINTLAFKMSAVAQQRTFEIYMGHTSSATATDYLNPSDLTLVYNGGPVTLTANSWTTFNLTTPFNYNGSDNLVVFFRDMTGSYVSGNSCYGTTTGASGCSRYVYQDGSAYTVGSYSGGTSSNFRPMLILGGSNCLVSATCADPALAVVSADSTSIDLAWVPGADETSWDLEYRQAGAATWTMEAASLSTMSYTITGLNPGTDYEFRISHECDNTTYSSTIEYTTPCVYAAIPYTQNFDNLTTGTATSNLTVMPNCWNYTLTGTSTYQAPSYYPGVYYSTSYANSGSYSLRLYGQGYFMLPEMSVSLDSLMMTFSNYTTSSSYGLVVGVMEASMFIPIDTINLVPSTHNSVEVLFSSYHGSSRTIAFRNYYTTSSSTYYSYQYIDDIVVDYLPACPHVVNGHATFVGQDSVTIAWTPSGEETEWVVSYGDTSIVTNEDTLLVTGLSPSSIYTFSIVSVCSSDDSSEAYSFSVRTACGKLTDLPYVQNFENEATTTSSSTTFAPCWLRFDNGSSYRYPYISSSASYNHTTGGSTGLYWYATPTTGTYGDYQVIVLPEVDTLVYPINTLKLSFWARSSSTSYQPVFYVGVMSNPDSVESFVYYDTIFVGGNTSWERYTTVFSNWDSNGSYIAIRSNRPSSSWTAYVDDIELDVMPACPPVEDIIVEVGTTSAIVHWSTIGNSYSGAEVEYRADSVSTWNSVTVNGNNYAVLTGLDANTSYHVRVSAVCTDGDGSAVGTEFTTRNFACAVLDPTNSHFDTITGTPVTSYQRPVNNFYRNTFSEQIYDSTDIAGPGTITAFSFNYGYSTPMSDKTNCMVYMANTTLSTISTSNYVNPSNMTLVYTGSLNCSQGWNEFELDVPFNYTGDNLAVAVIDNSGEYDGSSYVWNGHSVTGKSFSWYSDSYTYPNSSMSTNTDAFRPDMAFSFIDCIQLSTCAAPVVYLTGTTTNSASIVWGPGNNETSWNLYYREASAANYTLAATAVTATSYTFTGLNSGTMYDFKVENNCGGESLAYEVSASTQCAAIASLPFTENFNNWGVGTGVLPNCWSRSGSYSTYTYISASYNMTGNTGGSIYMYSSTGTSYSTLILPILDTTVYQVNQTQLVFNAMYTTTTYGRPAFIVGVVTDPYNFSTFVPVDTVQHSGGINRWETFEASLAGYNGTGAYVALRTLYDSSYSYMYIDDFTLEQIPTCPRPDSLTASNATTTTVDLGWYDRAGASQWLIEYGPLGFQLGTGTQVVVNTNPYTLTGLTPAYQGEYYVKAICGTADTGEFSRNSYSFNTSQNAATLPYHYDFENAAEWANWQTSSNSATHNWFRGNAVAGGGSYSMYVSADAGATYAPYQFDAVVNAAVYRDVDFGPVDSSYTLSFSARVGGTTTAAYDGMMVFLVDPSLSTVPSSSNITSPWGNVNDLYRIATVRLDTNWTTHEASFDNISGVHRVAFFWFNQNTGASYTNIPQPAAVDNIHIDYSSCPRPTNLDTVVVGGGSATLTWHGSSSTNYEVAYRVYGASASTNQFVFTTTNSVTLTGLNATTEYIFWVRKLCGAGDTSLWSDGLTFITKLCDGGTTVQTGDPNVSTTTSYNAPVNNFYNYTLSETIFDSTELGGPMDISSIAYYYDYSTASTVKTDVTIWIQPTNKTSFTSSSDLIVLDTSIAVQVYHGSLNCSQGWNFFGFATPYSYNGQGNLVVIVDDNSGDYDGSSYVFKTVACSEYRTLTWYSDTYHPDATSTSYSGTKTYYQWRPVMQLISCGFGCHAPVVANINKDYESATITISGNGNSYELNYGTDPVLYGNSLTSTNGIFNLSGLTPATNYYFRVRQECEDNEMSNWTEGFFVTDSLPCIAVTNLQITGTSYNGVSLSWTAGGDEHAWEVKVYSTVDSVSITSTGTSATVSGLVPQRAYSATVRPLCGNSANIEGPWCAPVQFTTDACQPVTNVTVSNITGSSASVSWTAPSGAENFRVAYGYIGFSQGEELGVYNTSSNPFLLTDLELTTEYTVQVATVCTESLVSAYVAANFTTTNGAGIDGADMTDAMSLYPNPASTRVTLSVSEQMVGSTMSIVDMNGREVASFEIRNTKFEIDLSDMAKGAYFVRLTGDEGTAVRKLIVK